MSRRSTKSAARSRTSGVGDQPSSHTDESSGRKQPSLTSVQSLPSATTVCQNEGSTLQPCTAQHDTTEIEALARARQVAINEHFYERLEQTTRDCECPAARWDGAKVALRRVGESLRIAGRGFSVLCCPPLLGSCLEKAGFFPPSRGYFFIREEKVGGSIKKVSLKKADKSSLDKTWSYGSEHMCFKASTRVECFVIETSKNHYIACVLARTPTARPRYTLLCAHNNGVDLSDQLQTSANLSEIAQFLDCDIVGFDYSGYGISSGRCSEKNLIADIEGVYQHMVTVRSIEPARIVIYGHSIGTAAAIALVAETQAPVAGVILLAPLASMMRVLLRKRLCFGQPFARRTPCIDKFRSIEKIALVNAPVLVCHGTADVVVPIEHGEAIYAKAPNTVPPLWIAGAGHWNLKNSRELWVRVRHFLHNELTPSGASIASSQPAAPQLATPLGTSPPAKPPLL